MSYKETERRIEVAYQLGFVKGHQQALRERVYRPMIEEHACLKAWAQFEPSRVRVIAEHVIAPTGWPEGADAEECFIAECKQSGEPWTTLLLPEQDDQ